MIRVMVVDDQMLLKQTLLFMLGQDEEIIAVDGGKDGYEAIEKSSSLKPDVILMDLRMPKMDGVEATKYIKEMYPSIKIMILTTFEDEQSVFKSIENNVDGYIIKDIKPEELIIAVKAVYNNLYVIHMNTLQILKEEVVRIIKERKNNNDAIDQYDLSPMEIKIIRQMVNGKNNKEIATMLSFTEGTIKNKVSKLLSKLGLKDRTQIVIFAIKHNLTC